MAQYTRQQLLDAHNRAIAADDFEAADELAGMLDDMPVEPQPEGPGFAESMTQAGERFQQRMQAQVPPPTAEGEQRLPRMRGIPLVSAAAEFAGTGIIEGAKALTPNFLKNAVSQAMDNVADPVKAIVEPIEKLSTIVAESDIAQEVLNTVKTSFSAHQERKNADPEYAYISDELESVLDFGLIMAPATKLKPVSPMDSGDLAATGANLKRGGRKQLIGDRKTLITKMLEPIDGFGEGKTTTEGIMGRKTYTPSAQEQETINVVSLIPNVDPKDTFINNYNHVEDYIGRTANRLKTGIGKAGNPQIDMDALIADIEQRAIISLDNEVYGRKGKITKIQEQLDLFRRKAGKGRALQVLEARQILDKQLKAEGKSTEADISTSSRAGRAAISGAVNDALDAAIPDVAVKDLLRKQFLSYRALDVLDDKRRDEADTIIGRTGQNLSQAGVNLPRNPASQVATGYAAGNVVTSGVFAYIAGAGATAAAIYGVGKAAMSAKTKKYLGTVVTAIDKALKKGQGGAELLAQLRADRAVIVSIMEDTRFNETEETPEEQ